MRIIPMVCFFLSAVLLLLVTLDPAHKNAIRFTNGGLTLLALGHLL